MLQDVPTPADVPSRQDAPPPQDESYWTSLYQSETQDGADADSFPLWEPGGACDAPGAPSLPGDWAAARQALDDGLLLELAVTGWNKGGVLVVWSGLQGFVPASQLTDMPEFHIAAQRQQALRERMGRLLALRVIEVDEARNRFILSERAARVPTSDRQRLLATLQPGEMRPGRITNLAKFGAFVDLGGLEGLIHISELSWARVYHPADIVTPDERVVVKVLTINPDDERVALSLKQTYPDPWLTAADRFHVDQIVTGIVRSVTNFGAFVELERGLEALVHHTELADGNFLHPRNVVTRGQQVRGRVLAVLPAERRLSLSMRRLNKPSGD